MFFSKQMKWAKVLKESFSNVGIDIENTEDVIIKNKAYFTELAKLLYKTSNKVIGVYKIVTCFKT